MKICKCVCYRKILKYYVYIMKIANVVKIWKIDKNVLQIYIYYYINKYNFL